MTPLFLPLFALFCAVTSLGLPPNIEVLNVIPTSKDNSKVFLSGTTPITVVFNRAVIPLGSDWGTEIPAQYVPFFLTANVSGRIRWVTTSIARFDPLNEWPSDLNFELKLNNDLTSFDEVKVQPLLHQQALFYTSGLSFNIAGVTSKKASNLTDGKWSSSIAYVQKDSQVSYTPEVPPDGVITLRFSNKISIPKLLENLRVQQSDNESPLTFSLSDCHDSSSKCAYLWIDEDISLEVDTKYQIILQEGAIYGEESGPLQRTIKVDFTGLLGFRFSFLQNAEVQYNRYQLFLRHGLHPDVNSHVLSKLIHIEDANGETIQTALTRPHAALIQLEGSFLPSSQYHIFVRGSDSIRDGFQLPLLASDVTFKTNQGSSFVETPAGNLAFEKTFRDTEDWSIIARNASVGNCPQGVQFKAVSVTPETFLQNLQISKNSGHKGVDYHIPSQYPETYQEQLEIENGFSGSKSLSRKLLERSGLMMVEQTRYDSYYDYKISKNRCMPSKTYQFVSSADLALTVFSTAVSNQQELTFWVTRLSDNTNVQGAKIYVYQIMSAPTTEITKFLDQVPVTLADGTVTVRKAADPNSYNLVAFVEYEGEVILQDDIQVVTDFSSLSRDSAQLITDRRLYKPNDKVSIKGYIRSVNHFALNSDIDSNDFFLIVQWFQKYDYPGYTSADNDNYRVRVSGGSFDVQLEVPFNVTYGTHYVSLFKKNSGSHFMLASTYILIADPRIPTVYLNLTSPQDAYRVNPITGNSQPISKGVELSIETKTYTGSPVENSAVTLKWQLSRGASVSMLKSPYSYDDAAAKTYGLARTSVFSPALVREVQDEQGTFQVSTDAVGSLKLPFTLEDLIRQQNQSKQVFLFDGDSINIDAEWIGPTGELLSASISFNIIDSEWKLFLTPTDSKPFPTYLFGFMVSIRNYKDLPLLSQPLDISLYEWDGDSQIAIKKSLPTGVGNKVKSCSALSNDGRYPLCQFSLPAVGKYVAIATSVIEGQQVVTSVPLGLNETEWNQAPLDSLDFISVTPNQDSYTVGEAAVLSFFNPFSDTAVLARWGNYENKVQKQFSLKDQPQGIVQLEIPLGSECEGGCHLALAIVSGRRGTLAQLPLSVPVSPFFDPYAPVTTLQFFDLDVRSRHTEAIKLSVGTEGTVFEPGSQVNLDLTVTSLKSGSTDQPVAAEVAIFVVDKALLDLVPLEMTNLSLSFALSMMGAPLLGTSSSSSFALSSAYQNSLEIINRRLDQDPWVMIDWNLLYPGELALPDEQFWKTKFSLLTYGQSYYYPNRPFYPQFAERNMAMDAGVAPTPSANSIKRKSNEETDDSSSSSSGATTKASNNNNMVRTIFQSSIFIGKVTLGSTGSAEISFKLPDNVGTFVLTAYAAHGSLFDSKQMQIISRKKIATLQPAFPRAIRYDDVFEAGAFIAITPDAKNTGRTLLLSLEVGCSSLYLLSGANQTLKINESVSTLKLTYPIYANGIGTTKVTLRLFSVIDDESRLEDATEFEVEVSGLQLPVTVSTSFALNGTSTADEELVLPNAEGNQGDVYIEAGVGRLPAVKEIIRSVMNRVDYTLRPTSLTLLSKLIPITALSYYQQTSEKDLSPLRKTFESIITSELNDYDTSSGLVWLPPDLMQVTSIDIFLNSFGLFVLNEVSRALPVLGNLNSPSQVQQQLTQYRKSWSAALWQGLLLLPNTSSQAAHLELLGFAYLGLGRDFTGSPASVRNSFEYLRQNYANASLSGQAAFALSFSSVDYDHLSAGDRQIVDDVVLTLSNNFRVQGKTAYLAIEGGSASPDVLANLLSLSLFTYVHSTSPLVEKLANWIGTSQSPRSTWSWCSPTLSAYTLVGLRNYDVNRQNTNPKLHLVVTSTSLLTEQTKILMDVEFTTSSKTPTRNSNNSFASLISTPEEVPHLKFSARGEGEVSVVVGMDFVPHDLNNEPIYRGIYVQKIIQQVDEQGNPRGPHLTRVEAGVHVKVTIEISSPDFLGSVMVIDPLPGCLEALDPKVFTKYSTNDQSWRWYGSVFSYQEVHPDRVVWLSQRLQPGTTTVSYYALSNTLGVFTVPSTKAFQLSEPSVMGLSAASNLTTKALQMNPKARLAALNCQLTSAKLTNPGQQNSHSHTTYTTSDLMILTVIVGIALSTISIIMLIRLWTRSPTEEITPLQLPK